MELVVVHNDNGSSVIVEHLIQTKSGCLTFTENHSHLVSECVGG